MTNEPMTDEECAKRHIMLVSGQMELRDWEELKRKHPELEVWNKRRLKAAEGE